MFLLVKEYNTCWNEKSRMGELMPSFRSEGHLRLGTLRARHLEVIQLAIDRDVAPTGRPRELNAHLFQGSTDSIRANVRVFRELFDFLNR